MRITKIDCHVLLIPDYDVEACSSAQDDLVIEIHTDEGLVGIGETDTNPWVARECIRAVGTHCMGLGLEEMLLGADPLEPEAIWQEALQRLEDDRASRSPHLRHGRHRHGAVGHLRQGTRQAGVAVACRRGKRTRQ